jgi:hypothetical protein
LPPAGLHYAALIIVGIVVLIAGTIAARLISRP